MPPRGRAHLVEAVARRLQRRVEPRGAGVRAPRSPPISHRHRGGRRLGVGDALLGEIIEQLAAFVRLLRRRTAAVVAVRPADDHRRALVGVDQRRVRRRRRSPRRSGTAAPASAHSRSRSASCARPGRTAAPNRMNQNKPAQRRRTRRSAAPSVSSTRIVVWSGTTAPRTSRCTRSPSAPRRCRTARRTAASDCPDRSSSR